MWYAARAPRTDVLTGLGETSAATGMECSDAPSASERSEILRVREARLGARLDARAGEGGPEGRCSELALSGSGRERVCLPDPPAGVEGATVLEEVPEGCEGKAARAGEEGSETRGRLR